MPDNAQQGIAHGLGFEARRSPAPAPAIAWVCRGLLRVARPAHHVDAARHDRAVQPFETPAAGCQIPRHPVEQLGVARACAHTAEIAWGGNDSRSEVVVP